MPNLTPEEHRAFEQWLYLESDGELTRAERARLESHLAGCAACRTERRDQAAMAAWLASAAVEPDAELARQVMARLPAAGWESRSPKSWRPAVAAVAVMALAAALVAALGGDAGAAPLAPVAGAARAVLDLLATTAVAGAGLLTASWQGLGLALGEVFGGSRLTLAVFAVFVAGVDFLFVRYLVRRPREALAERRRQR